MGKTPEKPSHIQPHYRASKPGKAPAMRGMSSEKGYSGDRAIQEPPGKIASCDLHPSTPPISKTTSPSSGLHLRGSGTRVPVLGCVTDLFGPPTPPCPCKPGPLIGCQVGHSKKKKKLHHWSRLKNPGSRMSSAGCCCYCNICTAVVLV